MTKYPTDSEHEYLFDQEGYIMSSGEEATMLMDKIKDPDEIDDPIEYLNYVMS